jgi:hypothetical protein
VTEPYSLDKRLGHGIEPGVVVFSLLIVYDLDGDGKAEVALKTAGDDFVKDEKRADLWWK